MRVLLAAIALAIAPVAMVAQEADAKPGGAKATYEAIKAEYDKAVAEYRAAMTKVQKSPEFQKARKNRDREALRALQSKVKFGGTKLAGKARFAAKKLKNDPDVAYLYAWLVGHGGTKEIFGEAMETLTAKHLEHPAMAEAAKAMPALMRRRLITKEAAHAFLEKIASSSPHKLVQATALYTRAQLLSGRGASSADKQMAKEFNAQVVKLAPESSMAEKIRTVAQLQIGKVAPDIVAEDLDGVEFKLSDYRGKVVVLDFWGDW